MPPSEVIGSGSSAHEAQKDTRARLRHHYRRYKIAYLGLVSAGVVVSSAVITIVFLGIVAPDSHSSDVVASMQAESSHKQPDYGAKKAEPEASIAQSEASDVARDRTTGNKPKAASSSGALQYYAPRSHTKFNYIPIEQTYRDYPLFTFELTPWRKDYNGYITVSQFPYDTRYNPPSNCVPYNGVYEISGSMKCEEIKRTNKYTAYVYRPSRPNVAAILSDGTEVIKEVVYARLGDTIIVITGNGVAPDVLASHIDTFEPIDMSSL